MGTSTGAYEFKHEWASTSDLMHTMIFLKTTLFKKRYRTQYSHLDTFGSVFSLVTFTREENVVQPFLSYT